MQRDDSNHPADWWDVLHRYAREEGKDGAREPFMYMWVKHADGSVEKNPDDGMPPDVQTRQEGDTITLAGSLYQTYVLDPETGIAKNITDWPVRPW